jgi:hypothetical protein
VVGKSQSGQKRRDILTEFPAERYEHLIVRYAGADDSRVGHAFSEAAERLAKSYSAQPVDDKLLLPYMYLYRHALELELKHAIQYAAGLRRNAGHDDEALLPANVADRLKNKHRHRLMALVNELNTHMRALDLEALPADVSKILQRIAQADPSGESFRYSGNLPDTDDRVNFEALSGAVRYAYSITSCAIDVLSQVAEHQAEYLSDMYEEMQGYMEDAVYEDLGGYGY